MKKTIFNYLFALGLMLSISMGAMAQPGDGGFGDDPNDVPVDGGIIVLAVAGLGFASRKWLKD